MYIQNSSIYSQQEKINRMKDIKKCDVKLKYLTCFSKLQVSKHKLLSKKKTLCKFKVVFVLGVQDELDFIHVTHGRKRKKSRIIVNVV